MIDKYLQLFKKYFVFPPKNIKLSPKVLVVLLTLSTPTFSKNEITSEDYGSTRIINKEIIGDTGKSGSVTWWGYSEEEVRKQTYLIM